MTILSTGQRAEIPAEAKLRRRLRLARTDQQRQAIERELAELAEAIEQARADEPRRVARQHRMLWEPW